MLRYSFLFMFAIILLMCLTGQGFAQTSELDALLDEAEHLIMLGRYEEALIIVDEILEDDPENSLALLHHVQCYHFLGRSDELVEPMIPEYELSLDLIDVEASATNFERGFTVSYTERNWNIVHLGWPSMYVPIPAGWVTQDWGFSPEIGAFQIQAGTDEPVIYIHIASMHNDTSDPAYLKSFEEHIEEVDASIAALEGAVILDRHLVQNESIYFLLQLDSEERGREYVLIISSGYLYEGWYYVMSVRGYAEAWTAHYPIVQAIAANLYDNITLNVGVMLPDEYAYPENVNSDIEPSSNN
jgi:tetratricopeptide (TPR) repeat protein